MADYINEIKEEEHLRLFLTPMQENNINRETIIIWRCYFTSWKCKRKKANKHAVSDWMEIEKQRGISVTSSVLQFEYNDYCINILDTPGHQDFSEDTYRTLMAADSAVMVIDASKGVEAQTKKLFKVCLLRKIPIFTFINKMDRAAMDPFELMEHIESELGYTYIYS